MLTHKFKYVIHSLPMQGTVMNNTSRSKAMKQPHKQKQSNKDCNIRLQGMYRPC